MKGQTMKTTMKFCALFLGALAAYGQTVSLSDTLTNAVGGGSYTGRITVTLNAPGSAQPLYYSATSLTGWQAVYCLGVTGADCTTTTAAGVLSATLYANSTITPTGTSYSARFTPAKGSPWSETWVVTPSTTTLRQVRSTTVPTPTTTLSLGQIAAGGATAGQYLRYTGSAWAPATLSVLTDPTTTTGDLIYLSAGGALTRLGIGSTGQVLTVAGGLPSWAAASGGGGGGAVSSVFGRTGAVVASSGDYTTAQVTESGNLYYTDARARAAITGTAPVSVAAGVVSCPTCAVTSGSYADPAWITSLSYSKLTGVPSLAPTACEVVIGDPGAATPLLSDDNDAPASCVNVSGVVQTITEIACYANAGSPTVRPIITGGSATSLLSADLTCGTGSYATGTLSGTPTMAAGATIDANIASAGGVAKYIVIRITRRII